MRSATQGEKAALVQELHKEGHRLNDLLDAIGLSRSTYYYELGRTDKVKERNADLSNEIISYNLSTSPNMEQIKDMLNKAFERFPSVQGLIMHSNQGWQYQHAFYRSELQKHGIIQSMSRKGNCYDNCIMETFFGRLKNEMFYGLEKDYPSFESFSKAIAEYINYYNNTRIQAKTKWMPPSKFREASMMEA